MDESLSDFQEKKKKYTGPKSSQKQNTNKIKPRKVTKPIKGQKDIRTALKSKKNDLISYTKDFNEICKQSGVDVDSEQLQLAIALSKSLQAESQSDSNDSQNSESLNSQQRTGKIRTTLQEYGFRIPEIKITSKTLKRHKKQYKLLLTTETEKQQLISDKYSQLLFKHLNNSKNSEISEQIDFTEKQLYHLSTNVSYEIIKNNDIYYIENLIEKSPNSVGSLLKDWSEIPGRPISPSQNNNLKVKFCEIDLSHDDLNIILSGTLKSTKKILENKNLFQDCYLNMSKSENSTYLRNALKLENNSKQEDLEGCNRTCKEFQLNDENYGKINDQSTMKIRNLEVQATSTVSQEDRSVSPDIFDEEESVVIENSKNNIYTVSQQHDITVKVNHDFMDLTECANIASQSVLNKNYVTCKQNSQLSQGSNITKRISNDFMEITECVVTSPSPEPVLIQENTHLTLNICNAITENDNEIKYNANTENIDLTQSSNSSDSLPLVNISGSKNNSLDDTIILNDEEVNANNQFTNSNSNENKKEEISEQKEMLHFKVIQRCSKSTNESVFEEYFYQHSDDSTEKNIENEIVCLDIHETLNNESIYSKETDLSKNNESNNIDLTQSSSSSENNNSTSRNSSPKTTYYNKLGKKDDVSIDYDELSCLNDCVNYSKVQDCNSLQVTDSYIESKKEENINDITSNLSRNSEIFMTEYNELNYSTCKSKSQLPIENSNFDGISIIDDLCNVGSFNKSSKETETNAKFTRSMSDSFLPEVELKKVCDSKNEEIKLPETCNRNETFKELHNTAVGVETPKNSAYIVKTDQVTPMLDYESMSTDEVNKELDKYGLKPFKRKRAIQLLTHLYNQTHPFVESCSNEELPSPSKKRKQDINHCSQTALTKQLKSPKQDKNYIDLDKENNIYKITNEVPDIKDIPCNTEDWVFQKREKAKVHSCRVPLHIAFHNYVSCRRRLREAILRYEPVDIDVIHKDLVTCGHRYDPKDLLKFMDKKCITVKTTDNNSRNNKRY